VRFTGGLLVPSRGRQQPWGKRTGPSRWRWKLHDPDWPRLYCFAHSVRWSACCHPLAGSSSR